VSQSKHIYFLFPPTKLEAAPVTADAAQTAPVRGAAGGITKLTTVPTEQPTPRTELALLRTFLPVSTHPFWSAVELKLREELIMMFLI
jgi:hypothetical protein